MEDLDRKIRNSLNRLVKIDKVHSQVAISKETGVSRSMISAVINGTRRFPTSKRDKLFDFFGMTETEFLEYPQKRARELSVAEDAPTYPSEPDLVEIKYFPDVQASAGTGVINYDEFESVLTFDRNFLVTQFGIRQFRNIHIIRAVGDSMKGGDDPINPGDLLFINPNETGLISGGIFCVWVNGEVLVKRVSFDPILKSVELLSDNEKYKPVILDNYENKETFRVIGRVMGVLKKT